MSDIDPEKIIDVATDGVFGAAEWSNFWARDEARELVRAALKAIEAAGFRIVSADEPTREMLVAAALSLDHDCTAEAYEAWVAMMLKAPRIAP